MNRDFLFIIGAPKAGTTSLQAMLNSHPEIWFSPIKEPNHFCTDIKTHRFSKEYRRNTFLDPDRYFSSKELKNIQLSFIEKREDYLRLFEAATEQHKILAEASTSYLYSSRAAKEIHDFEPKAKILAILRNPAERAFSHYLMALRYGYTTKSFRKEIEEDRKNKNRYWGQAKLYLELGYYYEELKRYYMQFPGEQIKIMLFEDFTESPLPAVNEVIDFLGLEKFPETENTVAENTAVIPKNYFLNSLFSRLGIKNQLKNILGKEQQEKLKSMLFKRDELPELKASDREFLKNIYQEDIQKTASLINKDLGHWLH